VLARDPDFFTDQNTAKNKNILKINPDKGTLYRYKY
jgi:hypothetical protein